MRVEFTFLSFNTPSLSFLFIHNSYLNIKHIYNNFYFKSLKLITIYFIKKINI